MIQTKQNGLCKHAFRDVNQISFLWFSSANVKIKSVVEITSRVHPKTIVFFSIAMNIGTVFTQISKNNNSNYW